MIYNTNTDILYNYELRIILSLFIAFPFVRLKLKSNQINDDYSSCFQNEKYREGVSVENVECITQDVSCGYAVIEMFSKWDGGDNRYA